MFSRFIPFFAAALAASNCAYAYLPPIHPIGGPVPTVLPVTVVIGSLVPLPTVISPSDCTTGPIQCCQTVEQASTLELTSLEGLIASTGVAPNVLIGVTCTPINVLSLGGNSCSAQAVCCKNNNFGGVIAVDCVPVNLE